MPADPAAILANHIVSTQLSDIPSEALHASKRDILDTLGAMLGGSPAPGVPELSRIVFRWGGLEESSVILSGRKVPAPQAALLNATMGHALDFDDTLDRGGNIHPGVSVLATAMAVSESLEGVLGPQFLLAVTLGLDVSCRLALAGNIDRGWHRTATYGIFGAAATAAKLLDLNVEQTINAFGIAYSQAAGNRQCIVDGALTKRLQAGQAASSGVVAAELAQEGFTGAADTFAGRYGFFPMYQPEGYNLGAIEDDLGTTFRGVEISFKPYACGRPSHALIDAALALYQKLELAGVNTGTSIAEVKVTTSPSVHAEQFGPGIEKRRPSQVVEAQFSIPFLIAAALTQGKVGIGEVAGVENPQVLALSDRVQGIAATDAKNRARSWGRIQVSLADGRVASEETSIPSGSPERPLIDDQLQAKFRDCAAHAVKAIPSETMNQAIHVIWNLETAEDATDLVRLFA